MTQYVSLTSQERSGSSTDDFFQPVDSSVWLFGFCTQMFVADVQPVSQYSNSPVNAVDGIYGRF